MKHARFAIPALTLGLVASLSAGVSVFRNGLNGYTGTADTEIREGAPATDGSNVTVLNPDGDDGGEVHILIRFDDIIGTGPGQIPPGKQVQAVTLRINITGGGDVMKVHRMLKAWQETTTWNQFGPGSDGLTNGVLAGTYSARTADDTEAVFTPEATVSGAAAVLDIPLLPSTVQAWIDGQPNYGWAILPTGGDGVDFRSSENSDVANRPQLTVTWGEPGQPFVVGLQNPIAYDPPGASPGGFNVVVLDGSGPGATQLNPNSVQLKINGTNVPTTLTKSGVTNLIAFRTTDYLASGSSNVATIQFTDTSTPPVAQSEDLPFTVATWVTIPAALAVNPASVNKSNPGFMVRVHQMAVARPGANNLPAPILQLNGGYIDPATSQPYANRIYKDPFGPPWDANDFTYVDGVVNMEQLAVVGVTPPNPPNAGNFNPNQAIPGIPGLDWDNSENGDTAGFNNIAAEFITYLDLKAGLYSMGVNSDDGFVVSVGDRASDPLAFRIGLFDGGRGEDDTIFAFVVEQDGIYPFSLLWWEGGGGASVEWFTASLDGTKRLINDSASSVKAYRTGPIPPQIRLLDPAAGAVDVPVASNIRIVLGDGTTQVQQNSIQLTVGGQAVTPNVSKAGALTTIVYDPPADFVDEAVISVGLTFRDNAATPYVRTETYTFTAGRSLEYLFKVDTNMVWRFSNQGLDLGTAWSAKDYIDSSWPQGAALLALESGAVVEPIRTQLVRAYQGTNIITDYFRGRFTLTKLPWGGRLQLRYVVDDAVIFYINGQEVHRFGMGSPGTAVTYQTFGTGHEGRDHYDGPALIVATNLVVGDNVIAAEVHQSDLGSSDVVFGAELAAVTSIPPLPQIKSRSPAANAVNVPLGANIVIVVSDGAGAVNTNSVQLRINDQLVTPVVTRVGTDTTITYDPPVNWPENTTNKVDLSVSDSAAPPNVLRDIYTFTTGYDFEVVLAVDATTPWRYSNVGADLGTAWKETTYDDSAWPQGPALLAQETGTTIEPIRTTLARTNTAGAQIITDYFRAKFNLTTLPGGGRMLLRLVVDDGAVVYINGQEVYRFGIAQGLPVDVNTLAASYEGRQGYVGPFLLVVTNLVVGDNYVAAELHQTTADSSDSVFGAELAVVTSSPPVTERPKFNAPTVAADGKVTLTWTGAGTLQESKQLPAIPADWTDVTPPPTGNTYTVTPDAANPQKYYRIRQAP